MSLTNEEEHDFHVKIMKGIGRKQAEKDYYNKLGLDYNSGKYVIPGVDGLRGNGRFEVKLDIYPKEIIFPLKEMEFNKKLYYCPNNNDYYLKSLYNNYNELPKVLHRHNRLKDLSKKNLDFKRIYGEHITKLRNINQSFQKN